MEGWGTGQGEAEGEEAQVQAGEAVAGGQKVF